MHLMWEEKGEQEKVLADGDSKFYILLYQNNFLSSLWKKKKILGCVYSLSIATYDFTLGKDDECLGSCLYCP
jgi:hypothetical protein